MKICEKEEKIKQFWEENKIYEKLKEKTKNYKPFYFLDGPPYATGYLHIGTALNKILKDFFIRFFRMNKLNVWDQPGFDTHGLPIEVKVEKKLGFKSKKDIENFGIENFIKECRKFATQFIGIMSDQFKDLGVWMDWKNPYLTLTNEYIEGAWYTFKKAFEKGFLYKGVYPVHLCPRCETAVAYNEIEYKVLEDPAIYVKFELKDEPKTFLICFTTTPWTLPSNTGIMVHPKAEYVKVKVDDENWIVAKDLAENLMEEFGITDYQIIETFVGKELVGKKYINSIAELFPFTKELENAYRIVPSEKYVSLEEGTGLVHCAPGHGKEDFEVGKENNLPVLNPLKIDGKFNENSGILSGIFAKDADKIIIEELKKRNVLVKEGKIKHEYPTCWRCDSPLLLVALPQWFFKVTSIREKLLEENEKIKWIPEWAKQRFRNWLESLGDWPISRQRYWGIPLPIWICDKCENVEVIGSREELPEIPKDFHKPYIDKITWKCKKCGKGTMKRIPDVLDVWFDSGIAPWASLNYPKEKELFEKLWPVNFILEGPDQIRGWWNSLLITSVITFGRRPFESVLFHGFVLDAHGVKMSKSKGNIIEPKDIIEKYGRDILRFYFLNKEPWNDYFFKWQEVDDLAKKFVIVRNVFNFVKNYVENKGNEKEMKIEDKWIISKLNSLIEECTDDCKNYYSFKAANKILDFVLNDFSRFYLKLIRERVWPTYEGKDKDGAFYALFKASEVLVRMLAPFVPFLAEEVYQNVIKKFGFEEISVHLLNWPEVEKDRIDKKLEEEMEIVKEIWSASLSARNKAKIKLRWPVKEILVLSKNENVSKAVENLNSILKKICNSKFVKVINKEMDENYESVEFKYGKIFLNKIFTEELTKEALVREIIRQIQEARKKEKLKVEEEINLYFKADKKIEKIIRENEEIFRKKVNARKIEFGKEAKYTFRFEDKEIGFSFSKI